MGISKTQVEPDSSPTTAGLANEQVQPTPEQHSGPVHINKTGSSLPPPNSQSSSGIMKSGHTSGAGRAQQSTKVQRQLGNARLSRMMNGPQTKIPVGQPGDRYEQEADEVASRIVSGQKVARISRIALGGQAIPVERQEEEELMQGMPVQRQPEEEEMLQGSILQRQPQEDLEEEAEAEAVQTIPIEKQPEDEELMQGIPVQRQPEDEELMQGMPVRRQTKEEDEELLQAAQLQRQTLGDEEEEFAIQTARIQHQPEEKGISIQKECSQWAHAKTGNGEHTACAHCNHATEDTPIRKQTEKEEETDNDTVQTVLYQPKGASDGTATIEDSGMESHIKSPGGGRPLPDGIRTEMEAGLGVDFSAVRVHDTSKDQSTAKSLNAKAFAYRDHIWMGPGASAGDRKLMAHELTHVVQQGGAVHRQPEEAESSNEDSEGQNESVNANSVSASVDVIVDALEGYTSRWDSENIINEFRNKGVATTDAILSIYKSRSGDNRLQWLFGDLTAEDREALRSWLIARGVKDMQTIVVQEIIERLEGYTSENDSHEILERLRQFSGGGLDSLLMELVQSTRNSRKDMVEWLFGDLDRVSAEGLRDHFFGKGGSESVFYAIAWTVTKIISLISGYTSRADSAAIVRYFRVTPAAMRQDLYDKLEIEAQQEWKQSAENVLMEDLREGDYRELRSLGGVKLRVYDYKKPWYESLIEGAEWALIIAEWLVCGLAGIVTGLLSVLGDFLEAIWSVIKGISNLFWSAVYLLSGGASGSENWLAVKRFFIGIGEAFSDPGAIFDNYWEELKLEFATIEGPLSDCRRAEFVVRKFINGLVNLVLIFAAGYGAVRGGLKAITRIAKGLRKGKAPKVKAPKKPVSPEKPPAPTKPTSPKKGKPKRKQPPKKTKKPSQSRKEKLLRAFRRGKKIKNIEAVSLKRLRNVLGRAGAKPGRYKLKKASESDLRLLREAGADVDSIYGWMSRDGAGRIVTDFRGRPIIKFTKKGLSSLEQAVKTFGHEVKHIKDFAAGLKTSSEALAELAGEKLWVIVQKSLSKRR